MRRSQSTRFARSYFFTECKYLEEVIENLTEKEKNNLELI